MLITVILLILIDAQFMNCQVNVNIGIRSIQLDNRKLTFHVSFELSARSKLSYAAKCASDFDCVTFTFTKSSRLCRGHSVFPTTDNAWLTLPDTKAFTFLTKVKGCPRPGYHQVSSHTCLRLYQTVATHSGAKQQCGMDNANLYTMKTRDRADMHQAFIRSQGLKAEVMIWLDGEEPVEGGGWEWGDGDPVPLDSPLWHPDEPNDYGDADCLCTYYREPLYQNLDDTSCSDEWPYVCEISLNP